jgi:hypothetical protein
MMPLNKFTELEDTLFPVLEVPIPGMSLKKELGWQFDTNADSSGYKLIINDKTGNIISCMTEDYKLVKNETIIDQAIRPIENRGGILQECVTTNSDRRTYWKWNFPDIAVPMDGEEMNPTIEIHNSYDGSTEIRILGGTFRLVCSNGLMVGTITSKYKNKHLHTNSQIDNLGDLIEASINNITTTFGPIGEQLADRKLKTKDIAQVAKELFPQRTNDLFISKVLLDKPKTYWDLLNVCTNLLTHHMHRDNQTTRQIESRLLPTLTKLAQVEVPN